MELVPYYAYSMETEVPVDEVRRRLNERTRTKSFVANPSRGKEFHGTIGDSTFIIKRFIPAQPLFAPKLHGRMIHAEGQTKVALQVVPNTFVLAVVTIQVAALAVLIFTEGWQLWLTIVANAALAWVLLLSGFWLDAGSSRIALQAALNERSEQC